MAKPVLVNLKEISSKNINKNKIFKLNFSSTNFDEFINKQALLMSQISLSSKNLLKIPKDIDAKEKKRLEGLFSFSLS